MKTRVTTTVFVVLVFLIATSMNVSAADCECEITESGPTASVPQDSGGVWSISTDGADFTCSKTAQMDDNNLVEIINCWIYISATVLDSSMNPIDGAYDEDNLSSPGYPSNVSTAVWPIGNTAWKNLQIEIPDLEVGYFIHVWYGADIMHIVDPEDPETWVHAGDECFYQYSVVG